MTMLMCARSVNKMMKSDFEDDKEILIKIERNGVEYRITLGQFTELLKRNWRRD